MMYLVSAHRDSKKLAKYFQSFLSVTYYAGILTVATIMASPASMCTVHYRSFSSMTVYFIHPDGARSLTVSRAIRSWWCTGKPKLTAHHISIIHTPPIITHCAPLPIVINLHAAIVSATIYQTDWQETLHAGVSTVCTIMVSPSTMSTVIHMRLTARACQVVHPNWTSTLAVGSATVGSIRSCVAKLPTHYVSIADIPRIVTNCPPLPVIVDFNPSNGSVSTDT